MPEALKYEPLDEDESRPPRKPREPRKQREPREGRSRAFPIALAAGLVIAIVAGLLLGGGGGGEDEPTTQAPAGDPVAASSGGLAVELPAGYAQLDTPPELTGLDLAEPVAYAPGGREGGTTVLFGRSAANDSTLLPGTFRETLGLADGEVPERTAVKLGPDGLQAYRYADLEPDGAGAVATLYASPTSEGVATVACLAPPADAGAFKGECEAIANTLQDSSGKPFPVGPDPGYAKLLGTTFGKLDKQVAKGRKALGKDKTTFRAQAAAARDIQAAYAGAARSLKGAEISPADQTINKTIVASLNDVAAAWKKTAAAASDKNKAAFARSEAAIKRAQAQLVQNVKGLEAAGYKAET